MGMTKNRDLSKETLHLYIRLSKGDDESYSLEYQEEIGLRRFEELGFKDYVIHNEGIVSGGDDSLEKRPVMKNLFDEIEYLLAALADQGDDIDVSLGVLGDHAQQSALAHAAARIDPHALSPATRQT